MNIPKIKNAYKNICNACTEKLNRKYPHKIPKEVQDRLDKELFYLKESDYIDDFEIARLLFEEAHKSSQYISCRGTINSSLILYLLSGSHTNPLPPHYICPNCGEFKTIPSKLFGIDFPEDKCPVCNSTMESDGYNLNLEFAWGTDGKKIISFEYSTSDEFYPYVKQLLKKIYPNNSIVPYGILNMDSQKNNADISLSGFVILSSGHTIEDYPDLQGYLDNGDLCITGNIIDITENNMKRIELHKNKKLSMLVKIQRATGIYINEISTSELRDITWNNFVNTKLLSPTESEILKAIKPETKTKLINTLLALHSTYSCCHYESDTHVSDTLNMLESEDFKQYPFYSSDDVFYELLNYGFSIEKAFTYTEYIRKGFASDLFSHKKTDFSEIPEDIMKVARTIKYAFPRSHSVEYALSTALLAYYLKADSKAYTKLLRQL